jgi:dolichol-phosphate mannosyltransferase
MKKTVRIICPVYNESNNVKAFIKSFDSVIKNYSDKYLFEYFFLDNNSTDNTLEIIESISKVRSDVKYISYIKNYGAMHSIYSGIVFSYGKVDGVAIFDCDLQDPPSLLSKFLESWEEGYYFIYGKRKTRVEIYALTLLRKAYRMLEKKINGYSVDVESGAWFLDQKIVEIMAKNTKFDPYLPGLLSRVSYKSKPIPYDRKARKHGYSKFNFFSYLAYSRDGIFSGSITPLRVSVISGLFLFVLGSACAIYFLFAKFYLKIQFSEGVAALLILMLLMFSFTFLILGIIGEYIGKIYIFNSEANLATISIDSTELKIQEKIEQL